MRQALPNALETQASRRPLVHGDMNLVVTDFVGPPLLAVPGDPVAHLPLGEAEADPVFSGQLGKAAALLRVLDDKPEPAPLGPAGIGVAMHGSVRSELVSRTSTRSGLTSPCH